MRITPLVFGIFLGIISHSFGQQSAIYTSDLVKYNRALTLYNSEQYLASQTLFTEVKAAAKDETVRGDCAYYIANAAVRLNQQGADNLVQAFVEEFPTSVKRNDAYINVADYYFTNGKYAHARKWYDKVDEADLSGAALEKYWFNNGYAFFKSKQYDQAKRYFNRLRDSPKYGSQAKYYEGFIAYQEDDYAEADALFDQVEDKEDYEEELAYFKADLNFKLGKFQEAIDEGKSQLPNAGPREQSELNKIIGESYFNLEQYAEALPYLKEFKGRRGRWNNTDYYQIGYAYFKQGDYEGAINEFNKIIDGRNAVAQNAYYHLAESYLKTDKKQQALNAFKNASEMSFDAKIKEDSGLNYAKLSYEIGNAYQPAPEVIAAYIKDYPQSPAKPELENLLIDSYITSKNYGAAITLLKGRRDFESKKAYQKVAFYRGIELYNTSDYQEARSAFEKSLDEPRDPTFVARATYWKAECDYNLGNFKEAVVGFKQYGNTNSAAQTPEYSNLNYNLAYAYFSDKDYLGAAPYFELYATDTQTEPTTRNDALLRLGDCRFISSTYWPAIEAYNQALAVNSADKDYATFQKAMSYGFVGRDTQKVEVLSGFSAIFPSSGYRDDALYELGNVYVDQEKNELALAAYDQLIREVPSSSYISKAQLKKALIFDNNQQSDEALTILKRVASNFPGTPEALQAVATAKLIYIDLGQVDAYGQWVSTLDFVDVEVAELDDAAYTSAEQQYVQNNHDQADRLFEAYLQQYPNGQHALKAHFYAGQLAFAKADYERTKPHYQYVIAKERSEFTEQALARLGQVWLSERNYTQSVPVLKQLETEADFPQNVIFAQSNLMKSYYELVNYEEAITYAEKVLTNDKIDNTVKSDAQIIIARSAIHTGDEARAKEAYAEVQTIATGILAAEALYYEAYFKHNENDFEASNASIQTLARDYSGHKEFGAKGLVLMARNFYALKDTFQATYILESVIQNFADYPELTEEAQSLLTVIKAEASKTNTSVEKEEDGGN